MCLLGLPGVALDFPSSRSFAGRWINLAMFFSFEAQLEPLISRWSLSKEDCKWRSCPWTGSHGPCLVISVSENQRFKAVRLREGLDLLRSSLERAARVSGDESDFRFLVPTLLKLRRAFFSTIRSKVACHSQVPSKKRMVAERVGFEPTVTSLPRPISNRVP